MSIDYMQLVKVCTQEVRSLMTLRVEGTDVKLSIGVAEFTSSDVHDFSDGNVRCQSRVRQLEVEGDVVVRDITPVVVGIRPHGVGSTNIGLALGPSLWVVSNIIHSPQIQ